MFHFFLHRCDTHGANFEFSRLGDGIVTRASENVDLSFGEAKGGEDRAARALSRDFDLDLDFASSACHLDHASISKTPVPRIVGVDFEGFAIKEVVDTGGSARLGASVIGFETTPGGQPYRVVVVNDFGGVAVANDAEESWLAVLELIFVQNGCTGMIFVRNGPLILALVA